MALFKILKGQGANLPSGKVEGYAYVTTDTHKFYVDISASERIELNAFAADRLSSLGTAHQALVGKASDDAISANPVWRDVSPSVSITNGTTAGPTVKITVLGEDSLATAFPIATAARSGVINVGDQVFFGNKKFQMKDTIELRTGDKPYWINKNLDWEATSYKRWVILLVPELTASNQVVNNFLEGKFCFYKLGGNLLDAVDLTLNVCYNEIKYYLQNFGDNATFNLCRVVYNNIAYIALNVGYQSNPYSSVSFTGHVYSTLDGGNEGANFPLNLPFAVNYRTEAHGDTAEIINNAEVNSSITDTLTTSLITNVTRYNLKFHADGANITNLNASNLMNGTVPLERIPSLPTSKITSGVLPVARGGTGVGSWTVNQVVLTNASDGTGAFTSRGYKDSTSAEAIGTTSDFVTERDIYYGLPKINNSHAYTSNIGIYAPNGHGNASSALMGNDSDAAPTWVAVAPSAAFANGTDSAGPSLTITVLGLTSTGVVIPKGSTSIYGVLKLTDGYTSTDSSLAVTGKSIKAAIDQLDVAEVGGSGKYISAIKEVDGKITATVSNTSVSNSWANGTSSAGPSLTTTVNGVSATAAVMPKGSTSIYGALKLTNTYTSTDDTLAATGKSILAAIQTLDVSSVGGAGKYISAISETDGKISATVSNTSVSNSWANGTTAGPSITTTVNGVAATAAVIPSASADYSGVVTTGTQTFAGNKTFKNIVYFANGTTYYVDASANARLLHADFYSSDAINISVSGTPWPYIQFSTRAGGSTYVTTAASTWCQLYAQVPAQKDSTYYKTRFFFRQYSKTANTTTRLNYYEDYYLPETNDDRTANAGYNILTTKSTVTTAQGGTGNTSYTASRLIYSNTATKLASSNIESNGDYIIAKTYLKATTYVYATTYVQAAAHMYIDTGHLNMKYNGTWYTPVYNHNNGNISINAASAGLYVGYQNTTFINWMNGRAELRDGCLSLFPNNGSYREGLRIHATGSWSDITLCGNDNTGNSGTSANSWFIGNNNGNFYISRNGSSSGTSWFGCVSNVWKVYGNQANSKSKQQSILHIYGPTCGNTAADMISGTAGLFSWGDGGPQITFDTSATPGGSQAGALIYTDHDSAATGASFHFVSNQSDWNVTSKRFHARTSITIRDAAAATATATSTNTTFLGAGYIELEASTPYIDFHYNNDTADYTFRLIANHSDGIHLTSKASTNCWLYLGNGTNTAGVYWQTFAGGWYMNDTKWMRSYNSKPVIVDIGTNNTYGIGGHRLALAMVGGSHVSWIMKGGSVIYGFCVNGNGNWYFGRRTNDQSLETTTNDAYGYYGDNVSFLPNTDNNNNLGASSKRWKTIYAVTFYGALSGNASTATTWQTARTLTIGATGKSVNGSANVSWSKAEILGSSTNANFYRGDQTWSNTLNGAFTANGAITANGSYLKSTANSNTVTIGSQNTSWCHITNSANIPFYFSHGMRVNGDIGIYNTSFNWTKAGVITVYGATTTAWNGSYFKAVGASVTTGLHVGSGGTNRGVYDFTAGVWTIYHNGSYVYCGTRLYSAVWNDFAEYREGETTEGGRAVYDDGFGKMRITTERLQPGSRLTSDTFGISVGESDTAKTPIGVGGRVLAYPYRDRNEYHVGDAVCAAPNGTVDIMTREEIMMYPERIIGTVSEIPTYETWAPNFKQEKVEGSGAQRKVQVNGRIWIYVR